MIGKYAKKIRLRRRNVRNFQRYCSWDWFPLFTSFAGENGSLCLICFVKSIRIMIGWKQMRFLNGCLSVKCVDLGWCLNSLRSVAAICGGNLRWQTIACCLFPSGEMSLGQIWVEKSATRIDLNCDPLKKNNWCRQDAIINRVLQIFVASTCCSSTDGN